LVGRFYRLFSQSRIGLYRSGLPWTKQWGKKSRAEAINPVLDNDDFDAALRTAQAEFERHNPDVIVDSSRGVDALFSRFDNWQDQAASWRDKIGQSAGG